MKKYKDAEEHYLNAIEHDASNPNFYNNYGLLLQYALRKYGTAKEQYEIALKLDDGHALGHCNYGTILMQMVDRKYNKYYNEKQDCFDNPPEPEKDPYFEDTETSIFEDPDESYEDFILNGGYKKANDDAKTDDLDVERLTVYSKKYKSLKDEYSPNRSGTSRNLWPSTISW